MSGRAQREFRNAAIRQERCASCGRLVLSLGEAHHAIERQLLEREFPDRPELVWDIRLAVLLCVVCHTSHTSHFNALTYESLPRDVHDFAAELGLTWYIDQRYPRRGAA